MTRPICRQKDPHKGRRDQAQRVGKHCGRILGEIPFSHNLPELSPGPAHRPPGQGGSGDRNCNLQMVLPDPSVKSVGAQGTPPPDHPMQPCPSFQPSLWAPGLLASQNSLPKRAAHGPLPRAHPPEQEGGNSCPLYSCTGTHKSGLGQGTKILSTGALFPNLLRTRFINQIEPG